MQVQWLPWLLLSGPTSVLVQVEGIAPWRWLAGGSDSSSCSRQLPGSCRRLELPWWPVPRHRCVRAAPKALAPVAGPGNHMGPHHPVEGEGGGGGAGEGGGATPPQDHQGWHLRRSLP